MGIKNLANTFWQGALKVLELMSLLFICSVALIVVMLVIASFVSGLYIAIENFGVWSAVLYAIDWTLLISFIRFIFTTKELKGKSIVRIAKRIGIITLFIMALAFINVVLWAFGYSLLLIFGIKLAIGTTAAIGLTVTIVVVLLWLLVEYIKNQGWTKTLEKIVYGLGMVLVLAIVGLVIWFIVV